MIVPLRVELKPFERIVIGETVLINSGTRTSFLIDGDAPILREKDTVTPENANTPAKRLYLCVQTMYLKNDIPRYRMAYQGFLRDLRETNPGDRGNTASGRVLKPAILKSGAKIQVPIFIEQGEVIKVDTRTGEYVSRSNA